MSSTIVTVLLPSLPPTPEISKGTTSGPAFDFFFTFGLRGIAEMLLTEAAKAMKIDDGGNVGVAGDTDDAKYKDFDWQ